MVKFILSNTQLALLSQLFINNKDKTVDFFKDVKPFEWVETEVEVVEQDCSDVLTKTEKTINIIFS